MLILGTGGVALFGAQIAKAAGARVIVVSRSAEKLKRLRRLSLPVDEMIAVDEERRWEDLVLDLTGQVGADYVLVLTQYRALGVDRIILEPPSLTEVETLDQWVRGMANLVWGGAG